MTIAVKIEHMAWLLLVEVLRKGRMLGASYRRISAARN
jgi:hypothetical protein